LGPVSVRLVVDPPAELTVDGARFGEGRVPGGKIALTPGLHTFVLEIPDFPPKRLTRRVTPDTTTISLTIDVGLLNVVLDESAPAGGVAFLDGDRIGAVPLVMRKVEAGTHELTVRWQGSRPFRTQITVPRIPNPPLSVVVAPPP
jgi:hypothetical protein